MRSLLIILAMFVQAPDKFESIPDFETCGTFEKAAHEQYHELVKIRDLVGGWQAEAMLVDAKLNMQLWAACWKLRCPSSMDGTPDRQRVPLLEEIKRMELFEEIKQLKVKLRWDGPN